MESNQSVSVCRISEEADKLRGGTLEERRYHQFMVHLMHCLLKREVLLHSWSGVRA